MTQTLVTRHSLPERANYGTGSQLWRAIGAADTLVVFVHGFGGNALTTWSDFPSRILGEQIYASSDILFFGYDGRRSRSELSAGLLRQALDDLTTKKAYKKVVIAAHSLGSVVARTATADAVEDGLTWAHKVSLILYAPAHNGARIEALFASLTTALVILRFLPPLNKLIFPAVIDLEINSPTLINLKERVTTLAGNGKNACLNAKAVAFGSADRVVEPGQFCYDPRPHVEPGINHTEICKPSAWFALPASILEAEL